MCSETLLLKYSINSRTAIYIRTTVARSFNQEASTVMIFNVLKWVLGYASIFKQFAMPKSSSSFTEQNCQQAFIIFMLGSNSFARQPISENVQYISLAVLHLSPEACCMPQALSRA